MISINLRILTLFVTINNKFNISIESTNKITNSSVCQFITFYFFNLFEEWKRV